MTNYHMRTVHTRRVAQIRSQVHCISVAEQQFRLQYAKLLLAVLLTIAILFANLYSAYAGTPDDGFHCHTVLLNGTEVKDAPKSVNVGDEIVWNNVSNATIIVERNSGFHLFLPMMQAENHLTTIEPLVSQSKDTRVDLLGEPVSAWVIEPGESITMQFDQPNYYTFKIDGQVAHELELQVNVQ